MDFSNFNLTPSSKKALEGARIIADSNKHLKVIDLHLIGALLLQDNVNIDFSLQLCDVNKIGLLTAFKEVILEYKERKRKKAIYAEEISDILETAKTISTSYGHDYIGVDHIFLSILVTRDEISNFMGSLEIDLEKLIDTLSNSIEHGVEPIPTTQQPKPQPKTKSADDSIESCFENLNKTVLERGTFEIFGRDKEIDRAFEVLLRKNKSNVIFVGDAGVGKTAIVEGMVEQIVKRECPDLLLHKEIVSLDVTSVLSGTIYRGQMEEKMQKILKLVSENHHLILFIDEIHTIVGSGNSEGGLDLANILKPALSRGNISCIGATTLDEYKRYFEKDSALNRRFECISVAEPTKEETKKLLSKAKVSYEKFHQVSFDDNVLDIIIDLCEEYLPSKKFPDKAFDILDESGAKTKKIHIVRPQEAIDMEKKFKDDDFVESKAFKKHEEKYKKILETWGKKLEKEVFPVTEDTIYGIFAHKLDTTAEKVKNKNNIYVKGRIGFGV